MVTYSNSNNNNLSCNIRDIFRHFETDSCSNFFVVGPILKFWSGSGFSLKFSAISNDDKLDFSNGNELFCFDDIL